MKKYNNKNLALISIDLDQFKLINDRFGSKYVDKVIIEISNVLKNTFKEESICARICNNEFAVIFKYDYTIESIYKVVEEISENISKIRMEKNINLSLKPSIGIYIISEEDNDIALCIGKANISKNQLKCNYEKRYAIYDDKLKIKLAEEKEIENDIEDALNSQEFEVYLQPKVDIKENKIVGAEALIRWNHQFKGYINPEKFIPIIERNGFIRKIDIFIFEQVCIYIQKWLKEGVNINNISVNISRAYLYNTEFINDIEKIIRKYEVDPILIEIEITESAILENTDNLMEIIRKLKCIGFKIAMDDFGSGYSSLNMLKEMPIDTLKLDKEFFSSMKDDEKSTIIISSIVQMAQNLNIEVVAEGVENKEQVNFLKLIKCNTAQGYLFAKPMPISEYEIKFINKSL